MDNNAGSADIVVSCLSPDAVLAARVNGELLGTRGVALDELGLESPS